MPKRPNPFASDYSPLQMKIHVSQREVNMGVMKEENMKAVYDRTRQLLYSGQKVLASQGQEVEMVCEMQNNLQTDITSLKTPSPPALPNNQLRLNAGGCLVYGASPHKKESMQASSKVMCSACKNPQVPVHFVCAHCEKNLCYICRQVCANCESGFCSNCSTINYDERCDRVFCLNCAY